MPDNPQPPAPPAEPPPAPPPPAGPSVADLQAQLERQQGDLKKAREEAARYRTRNDEETGGLKKALGAWLGVEGDQPADANKVLEELQKRDQARERELASLRLTNALEQTARQHGADVDILAPYLRGSGRLDKLDPAAPEFSGQLDALVADLVSKQPKFKANGHGGQAPPRGGSEFPGGNQGPPLLTRDDLKTMTPEQIDKARKDGRIAGVSPG